MKNHINKVYYTPYQLKLSPEIEKIIEISDPVYTFNEFFHHIALNKHRLYTKCWGEERAYKINLKNFQKK